MFSDIWCPPCGIQRRGDQPAVLSTDSVRRYSHKPVRQCAVELQPVPIRPHAPVSQQIPRILMAEEVLSGRHRSWIEVGQGRLQRIIERIAGLLVPEQRILAQELGVSDGGFEIEPAVRIDRELRLAVDLLEHRFDALLIVFD